MSAEWRLDNYQVDKEGKPGGAKAGPKYRTKLLLDVDDDGKHGESGERVEAVDPTILLLHRKYDARMQLTLMPMSREYAERELRVLARNYVDAISGGLSATSYMSGGSATVERRLATRVLESRDITLYGLPAHMVTYEIADVDQIALTPEARWRRARVVLLRPKYVWYHKKHSKASLDGTTPKWGVLMALSYSNLPDDFEQGLEDFARFSEAIDLLDDTAVVSSVVPMLDKCEDIAAATMTLDVLADGSVDRVSGTGDAPKRAIGQWRMCLKGVPLRPTGERREVTVSYGGTLVARPARRHDVLRVPVAQEPAYPTAAPAAPSPGAAPIAPVQASAASLAAPAPGPAGTAPSQPTAPVGAPASSQPAPAVQQAQPQP